MKIKFKIPFSRTKVIKLSFKINRYPKESNDILYKPFQVNANFNKIFCIGFNKTGTTTLEYTLKSHGVKMAKQSDFAFFAEDWAIRNFNPIIEACSKAQAFQDFPFSFPYTFIALDMAFPKSKFILTVRDNPDQWYNSIVNFHGKLWANGEKPTKSDLQNAVRYYKGRPWQINQLLFNTPEDDPYNKDILIETYQNHITNVKQYFRYRKDDLLVINVSGENSYIKFCNFLGLKPLFEKFPWKNKT